MVSNSRRDIVQAAETLVSAARSRSSALVPAGVQAGNAARLFQDAAAVLQGLAAISSLILALAEDQGRRIGARGGVGE